MFIQIDLNGIKHWKDMKPAELPDKVKAATAFGPQVLFIDKFAFEWRASAVLPTALNDQSHSPAILASGLRGHTD